jgi:hypothetical protein
MLGGGQLEFQMLADNQSIINVVKRAGALASCLSPAHIAVEA